VIKSNKKVIIALSGGVDSAVSAALLKKQGFDVFGVFFRFFDGASAKKSLNKAKKVAESLDIDFEIVDARKEFQKKIVDYFIKSYKKGITPNPCVVCNREMKFALLFALMKRINADYVAAGHYARIAGQKLFEAKDKTKDQSYFLYRLTQKELAKIIFPLGEFKKTETKKMAKKLQLSVFGEEESQDVCFLSGTDINSFLKKYIKPKSGNIVDERKNILGKHKGLSFYTIGQRKGIEIGPSASRQQREAIRASGPGPYFVIGKNLRKNELIVSNDPKKLFVKKFFMNKVNWVNKEIKLPLRAQIQIRYHASKISAKISSGKPSSAKPACRTGRATAGKAERLIVEAKKPLRAVTPGQSAIFYKNSEVLGGGIIV